MKWTFSLVALTAITALLAASDSFACSPPPPPPPTWTAAQVDAHRTRQALAEQAGDWENAESVFIARVDELRLEVTTDAPLGWVTLRPALQLKGKYSRSKVSVRRTQGVCGPQPEFEAFTNGTDGLFLIYSADSRSVGPSTFKIIPVGRLVDPATIDAWRNAYSAADR